MLELGIFFGALLVCLAALPMRRSPKTGTDGQVVKFVPKSHPPRARVEAAGQVIEFPQPKERKSK